MPRHLASWHALFWWWEKYCVLLFICHLSLLIDLLHHLWLESLLLCICKYNSMQCFLSTYISTWVSFLAPKTLRKS
jgi:hypothetical protein